MSRKPSPAQGKPARADVLVAGGGQIGLALAVAIKQAAPGLAVTVIDATAAASATRAGRASTIVAGGRRMLQRMGVWEAVAAEAQAVNAMIVTDSRTRDAVRPVLLTFALAGDDGEAGAHVVADGVVVKALTQAAEAAGVTILAPHTVTDFRVEAGGIAAEIDGGDGLIAGLLVAADGANSRLRDLAGITTVGHDYGQSGIVATVEHERDHHGRAEEHFLPAGPFAILPMKAVDGRFRASLVWTEPTAQAETLVAGDPLLFQVELERRFGHRLGAVTVADTPRAYPLRLSLARRTVDDRLALVGDAAHTIHPIAGQGLNLGYRDVAALAETIVEAHRLGLDVGSAAVLKRYQRWRRYDTMEMALMTDGLNRLFANDNPLLRIARDVGLGVVDRLPGLKRRFIGEASAEAGGAVPRLLRGEAL